MNKLKLIILILFLFTVSIFCLDKYVKVDLQLDYESVVKKLQDNWSYQEEGPNGINKIYFSTYVKNNWDYSSGYKILTELEFVPFNNFYVKSNLKMVPQYADRFYQTVNDDHRVYLEKTNLKITNAEIKYNTNLGYIRYFKNVGHYHWGYEGDIFGLFLEQLEPERYLRVSGRTVPEGTEINLVYRDKKLNIFFGPEVKWGYHDGIYSRLSFNTNVARKIFTHTFVLASDKPEFIMFANPEERLTRIAYTLRFDVSKRKDFVQLGLLYSPFRLDKEFKYVEELKEGEGDFGSKYKIYSDKTSLKDAFGGKIEFNINSYEKFLEEIKLSYSYLGAVAGNKQEISLYSYRRFGYMNTLAAKFIYRKPIYGPLPLIKDQQGTIILAPRGPFDPFWVNWDNRETVMFLLTYTFDPTPYTWFYQYEPNVLDNWNLNPKEDAKLSFAIQTKVASYPTNTDRMYYWDPNGKITWEEYGQTGCWATKNYVGEMSFLSRYRVNPVRLTTKISFGDSLAKGSYPYTDAEGKLKPITNFYKIGLTAEFKDLTLATELGFNIWGPEDWFETFGESYDRFYQFLISKKFEFYGNELNLALKYLATRDVDKKYLAKEIAEFDEIYLLVSTKFGVLGKF